MNIKIGGWTKTQLKVIMSAKADQGKPKVPNAASQAQPAPGQAKGDRQRIQDLDMAMTKTIDGRFIEGQITQLPISRERLISSEGKLIRLPTINIDDNPSSIKVLEFWYSIQAYRELDPVTMRLFLDHAFQGNRGSAWCERTAYNFTLTCNMLINWMYKQDDWAQVRRKLETGQMLDIDLTTHIRRFKLVAMHMGLKAEDLETKQYFIRSIPGTKTAQNIRGPSSVRKRGKRLRKS